MNRSGVIRVVAVLFATVASGGMAWSEAPSRESLRDDVVMTRRTWFAPATGESFGGVWRYNPLTHRYVARLRPFIPTGHGGQVHRATYLGQDGYLAAHGDTVTYRTWPVHLDFDAFSWKLIRRRPTTTRPELLGWSLQGPMLSADDAAVFGLDLAVIGNPRCLRSLLAPWPGAGPVYRCEDEWPFAGSSAYPARGSDALYGYPRGDGDAIQLVADLEALDWSSVARGHGLPHVLSLDRGRLGLWQGLPTGVRFLPVRNVKKSHTWCHANLLKQMHLLH